MLRSAVRVLAAGICLGATLRADRLAGRVVQDHSGAPVASAEVRVRRPGVTGLAADLETDSNGAFEAPGLPPGDYRLEVLKPGYLSATLEARVSAASPAVLTLRLVRCGVISGRVTDAAGQAVMGARVFAAVPTGGLLRPLRIGGTGTTGVVDDLGRYRLYSLVPGEYAVMVTYGASTATVSSIGRTPPPTPQGSGVLLYPDNSRPRIFTLSGGEDFRDVDFVVMPARLFRVSGRVEPVATRQSFWIALTPVERPSMAAAVGLAGEDGSFSIDGVPEGSYYLFAAGPMRGYSGIGGTLAPDPLYARSRVDVAGQDVTGLALTVSKGRQATLRVEIVPGAESVCAGPVSVTLNSLEDWATVLDRTVNLTGAEPAVLENVAPARYTARASKLPENCHAAPAEAVLDLSQGSEAANLKLTLVAAGAIEGQVTGHTTTSTLAVFLVSPTPGQPIRIATPDSDGHFGFLNLAPGRHRIAGRTTAAEGPSTRWIPDLTQLTEVEVQPGPGATKVELVAPAKPREEPR